MQADVHRQAKTSRQARSQRSYYATRGSLGRPCRFCKKPTDAVLNEAGIFDHPTCGPSELALLRRS